MLFTQSVSIKTAKALREAKRSNNCDGENKNRANMRQEESENGREEIITNEN